MLTKIRMWSCRTELGFFKAESPKPVTLYCNKPFIGEVDDYRTSSVLPKSNGVATNGRGEDGKLKVYGGPNLKATQAYPRDFGTAMTRLYSRHRQEIEADADNLLGRLKEAHGRMNSASQLLDAEFGGLCQDGNLQPVFALLQRMAARASSSSA